MSAATSRSGKAVSILLIVLAGGIGIISSTQTWLSVVRADGGAEVPVAGATAVPVLAPLSLTVLALGAAIALVGPVLRYVFATIGLLVAIVLEVLTLTIVIRRPLSAVAPALTEVTGLAGDAALGPVVEGIAPTAWPWLAGLAWALLAVAAVLVLLTSRRWRTGGRRFETSPRPADGPVDAVESWDELSHGSDPTR
ncbi:Trp biosynthesis-associated membrane protein [Microbacterium resistens]|uniref:Trp biosynthesis-associated membrane protein n=1 Tax=Microbacterium resistens TaxID=156977 RepID=UPI00082EE9E6|nr:Trp biosynthesis-associated membrane protein [Microbacterium resistens]MBW1637876.1 Trp biosynthesis-associated membrane protein [Microbacterium resistens]